MKEILENLNIPKDTGMVAPGLDLNSVSNKLNLDRISKLMEASNKIKVKDGQVTRIDGGTPNTNTYNKKSQTPVFESQDYDYNQNYVPQYQIPQEQQYIYENTGFKENIMSTPNYEIGKKLPKDIFESVKTKKPYGVEQSYQQQQQPIVEKINHNAHYEQIITTPPQQQFSGQQQQFGGQQVGGQQIDYSIIKSVVKDCVEEIIKKEIKVAINSLYKALKEKEKEDVVLTVGDSVILKNSNGDVFRGEMKKIGNVNKK